MMECAGTEASGGFRVTARPNSAADWATERPGLGIALSILLPSCAIASAGFLALGAWPVALFMGLPLLGLAGAFGQLRRHAGDFERLVLSRDRLVLDRHTPGGDEHLEFNSQWVQVDLRRRGGGSVLTLRCHGKETVFGHLLSDEERRTLSRELKRRLALLRQ